MCAVPVEPSRESRSLARSRQIFVSTMYVGLFVYLLAFEARELHTDSLSQHGRCVPGLGGCRCRVFTEFRLRACLYRLASALERGTRHTVGIQPVLNSHP